MKKMSIQVVLEVDVDYDYRPAGKPQYDPQLGNWLPGDYAYIHVGSVRIGSVDITKAISKDELALIEESLVGELE